MRLPVYVLPTVDINVGVHLLYGMRTITFVLLLVNICLSSETCAALSPCQRHVGGEPHSECDEAPQAFTDSSVGSVGDAINYGLKVRNGSGGHGSKEEPTPSLPGLSHTALETGPIANSGSLSTLTTIWTNSSSHAGSGTVSVAESDNQTKSAENLGANPTKSFDGTASNGSSAISNSNTGVAIFVSVVPTNRSLGPSQTTRPPYPMNSTHTIGLDPELVSVISKYGPGITAAPRPVFVNGIPRFGNNTCDQHNKTSCPSTKTLKIGAAHQAQPGLFQIGKGWAGSPKEPSGPGALGPVLLANEGSAGEGSEVPSHAQAGHVTSAADADITRFSPEVHTSRLRQGAAFSPESHTTQTNMVVGPAAAGPSSTSTSQSRAGGNRGPDFTAWRHETAVPVQSSSSGGDSEIGGVAPGPDPGAGSVAGQDEANDSAPGGIPQPGGSSNHDNPAIPMQAPPVQAGRPPPGVPPAGQPGPGQVPAGQPPLNVPAASQQANGPQVPAPPPPGTGSAQPPLPPPRKGEPQITVGGAVFNVLPESTLEAHSTAAALRPVSSAGAGGIAFQGAHSTAAALRPTSSAGTGGAATHGGEPPGSGQIPPDTSDGTAGSADDPAAPGTSPGKPGSEEGGEAAVPGTVANPLGHVPQNVAHPAGSLPNGVEAGLPPQPPPPPGDVTAGSPSSPPPDNANPPKAASPVIITHSNSPIAVQPIAPSTITKGASTITQLPSGADFITSANQVFSPIASSALSFSTVSGIPIPVAVVPSVQQQTSTDESGEVHTFPLSVPPIPLKPAPPATTTIDALGNPQTIIPDLFPSPPSPSNPIGETGGNTATILPFAPPAPPGISIQAFPPHPLLITSFPTTYFPSQQQ